MEVGFSQNGQEDLSCFKALLHDHSSNALVRTVWKLGLSTNYAETSMWGKCRRSRLTKCNTTIAKPREIPVGQRESQSGSLDLDRRGYLVWSLNNGSLTYSSKYNITTDLIWDGGNTSQNTLYYHLSVWYTYPTYWDLKPKLLSNNNSIVV